MRLIRSLSLSIVFHLTSFSLAFAQVATAPASPTTTTLPPTGGEATAGGELPAAGFAAPTIILLALGGFFLIVGIYKFYQAFSRR